jgi:ATP-dependent helicase Lhr and Lhr-like helicase
VPTSPALDRFSPVVRDWFSTTFAAPTPAQEHGWRAIADGGHSLILAPTGSGKTLAAFLWAIDDVMTSAVPTRADRTRVLYISPLRALAVDVEKNLRAPLHGIRLAADRAGVAVLQPSVGIRTGDTPADERRRLVRDPPDILITTPESLYLMLTSRARETLRSVTTVIIDEIHSVAATKRGSHLALSLERLSCITGQEPQRIGLSATQRPLDEIARFLGGFAGAAGAGQPDPRPVDIVDVGSTKELDVEVVVGVDDMGDLGRVEAEAVPGMADAGQPRASIWPAVHPRLLELVLSHRSTLIFANARRLAERLATRLNELYLQGVSRAGEAEGTSPQAGDELVMAHHGSLSREQRLRIEDELKEGRLRGLVATSSLELGIDMGAVDLVVQVESPGSVASGLQRIGRAGHQVGEPSRGKIFPKHRGDLLEAAVVVQRMRAGLIEETRYPRNPLDVLCQQIVAMCAVEDWAVDELLAVLRRAAPYRGLSDEVFEAVLDLLSGRYPSDEFAELRPRIVWDRVAGMVRARQGAGRLAVTNPGTIPDRGLYGVFTPEGGRVGELDEEMVYESRVGETFLLGASTWRIEEITHDRVVVTPAPGEHGKMPFWHGDRPGRPLELGRAMGAFTRRVVEELPAELPPTPTSAATDSGAVGGLMLQLAEDSGLDERAGYNLLRFLDEQRAATGVVPDDRTVVVERFRDEIGDWRVCVLTPFGARVHAPWAIALQFRLEERYGAAVETLWSDDGIVLRLPESEDRLPLDDLALDPDEVEQIVSAHLPSTALFASRFREAAGRALLLPRRRPDQRTPLWQQRQRAADLLAVAARYPTFPILLETSRECLQEVFDVPALRDVLRRLRSREVRMVPVDTDHASPFAQSLLFSWIGVYMYEGDAPLAERRATALALDRDLLRDLLGAEELRELIDAGVLADLELDLQRLSGQRRARDPDEVHDLLRLLGDLSLDEVGARCAVDPRPHLQALVESRRAIEVMVGGEARFIAAEDAARYRDAVGCALPVGLPRAFTEPVDDPLVDLVGRFGRTHGPFLAAEVTSRLGVPAARVHDGLARLEAAGRFTRGEFRPDGTEREWCEVDVLRQLRRRSLATLRREVEPVEPQVLARFLAGWHGLDRPATGEDALVRALGQLQGCPLPASVLEVDVLAARVRGYASSELDRLLAAGDLVWVGAGGLGSHDGRIRLYFRDQLAYLGEPSAADERPQGPVHDAIRAHLGARGASFWPELLAAAASAGAPDPAAVLVALWDLVWAGEITNDTLAPVRGLLAATPGGRRRGVAAGGRRARPRPGSLTRAGPPSAAGRWSLVEVMLASPPHPTEQAHLRALQLVERHGVLTREAVLAEGQPGGFAGVYPVLKELEERGRLRRGYFVAGLGAAQFASIGAVDRLRQHRDPLAVSPVVTLAATDPAQPYGAVLPWPESAGRPARAAGAYVLSAGGLPAAYIERGGRSLLTFAPAAASEGWIEAAQGLVKDGRLRGLELARIDGVPAAEAAVAARLLSAGFVPGYRGLTYRV